jgi:CheY-like chemotaxis protein/HAMP domain-containing protein/putative methionine-R-sulfoxide reductase with GAF domain
MNRLAGGRICALGFASTKTRARHRGPIPALYQCYSPVSFGLLSGAGLEFSVFCRSGYGKRRRVMLRAIQNVGIRNRLAAGFSIVVVLALAVGLLSFHALQTLSGLTTELFDHPMTVTNAALEADAEIISIREKMLELVVADAPEAIDDKVKAVSALELDVYHNLSILRERYLGNHDDLDAIARGLQKWSMIRENIVALKKVGNRVEAEALAKGIGARQTTEIRDNMAGVIRFARNKAQEFMRSAGSRRDDTMAGLIFILIGVVLGSILIASFITLSINRPLSQLRERMARLAEGDFTIDVPYLEVASEIGAMARALQVFKGTSHAMADRNWVKSKAAEIAQRVLAASSVRVLARDVIQTLTPLLEGGHGVFYVINEEQKRLELMGSYAFTERKHLSDSFAFGEGIAGQSVIERSPILLTDVPADYIRIRSALGEARPSMVLAMPILSGEAVVGVIEIATFKAFTEAQHALIVDLMPMIALQIEILERRSKMQFLLEQSQRQAETLRASEEELQTQSEELRTSNEELQVKASQLSQQTEELRASEEELRTQREALQAINHELTEKGKALELSRAESEAKARQLGQASRYKSEFLANMSHELRTPLNSLLILAKSLADDQNANLTVDQIEAAQVIHDSGSQLLRLINDILDLSKIESGRVEIMSDTVTLDTLIEPIERQLRPMADVKGLVFKIECAEDLPKEICTDIGKVEQIVTNLLSNALKFTERGRVICRVQRSSSVQAEAVGLDPATTIAVAITDTGIGIPEDKREHIFLPFEQVDGTTSRRYGGTGLGLAISKKLARLIGGDITIESQVGVGSTFTLILPIQPSHDELRPIKQPALRALSASVPSISVVPSPNLPAASVGDDPASLGPGDRVILIVEDDQRFARILADTARRRGFKGVVAMDGSTGLHLARELSPTGIILDISLPGMDGWAVMDRLKEDSATRHIPVHFISATEGRPRGLGMGAVGYLIKPVTREQIDVALDRIGHFSTHESRRLLVVDDDPGSRMAIARLIGGDNVLITTADTGKMALELLKKETFDCVVLDLGLPDIPGTELLAQVARDSTMIMPPVVIYSAKELSSEETMELRHYTDSIVIKGARSPERLLDEVTLFLHSVQSALPEEGQKVLRRLHDSERSFANKTVLIVEDDMRNAFALSRVLNGRGLTVLMAQDGRKALKHLADKPQIDIVLMDIMMPEMDGYQTMREIRKQPRFLNLPIIALTAKAMADDREKCLGAGANDYLTKPIDIDRLLSMMRVWLHQ